MDRLHKEGHSPAQILKSLRDGRTKRGESGPSRSAVYSFLAGKTYTRGRSETRGRKPRLPASLVQTANRERIRLIKEADNELLVTWEDVAAATKQVLRAKGALHGGARMPSADWLARLVRAKTAVRARPGKRRISRFPKHVTARASVSAAPLVCARVCVWRVVRDCPVVRARHLRRRVVRAVRLARGALRTRVPCLQGFCRVRVPPEARYKQALEWSSYSQDFWTGSVHAYIDNKKFVVPRTALEKKLVRSQKVHQHLRTPAEGSSPGFVLPKRNKVLLGVPSIEITAAVGQHGVIMWHETPGTWNGRAAATMYAELGKALRKTYGQRRKFIVVEDGDTKGFQSNAGKAAKRRERITSMMLPPRSPGWMPLDFSLWDEIESRALAKRVREFEAVEAYKKRLAITARRLPARVVENCLARMKANIDETVASRGRHTRVE